jgi:hypothetical protein
MESTTPQSVPAQNQTPKDPNAPKRNRNRNRRNNNPKKTETEGGVEETKEHQSHSQSDPQGEVKKQNN